jgi:hypothetical protein
MKTIKLGVALCAALVIAVPAVANAVPGDSNGDPYVAPSYGSEKNVSVQPQTATTYVAPSYGSEKNVESVAVDPSTGYASENSVYVLADVPQEKFVSPAGVLRAGVTPNGDLALTVTAYSTELDGVCTRVGAAVDLDERKAALALDQAISDVEALATPSDRVDFQQQLVDLAQRQAQLLRTLPQASNAAALSAELDKIDADIDALFAQQGGFAVCGQA